MVASAVGRFVLRDGGCLHQHLVDAPQEIKMKPSIDEQIEAVEVVLSFRVHDGPQVFEEDREALEAALKTLNWVKRHAPLIKTLREEFPGSRIEEREE